MRTIAYQRNDTLLRPECAIILSNISAIDAPSEDLVGNGSNFNVVCGNSTAQILGLVLIPLVEWLFLAYFVEQPARTPRLIFQYLL